jgi:hypothetical protein
MVLVHAGNTECEPSGLRPITTADISRPAEARLITERDIRSDAVRIRDGCAPAADGAIAVAGPRRTASSSAASRAYLPWVHVPPRRVGPQRAGLDDDLG